MVDVQDGLDVDVLEVQLVRLVVIGAYRLRVVVDHDSLVSRLTERPDGPDRAPIELDRRTDTIHAGTEHHHAVIIQRHVVLGGIVREVQVVGERRELGGDRVDLLDEGGDACFETHAAHGQLVRVQKLGELTIAEAELLCLQEEVRPLSNIVGVQFAHGLSEVAEALELVEEPLVNLGHLPDLVNRVTGVHGVGDSEETLVRRGLELVIDGHESLGLAEAEIVEIDGTDGLLYGLLE